MNTQLDDIPPSFDADRASIYAHLEKTSRSFVIPISLLGGRIGEEMATSYLLLRIADSFEDATRWEEAQKIRMLDRLAELLINPSDPRIAALVALCQETPPLDDSSYRDLIADLGLVIRFLGRFTPFVQQTIKYHVIRVIQGMVYFISAAVVSNEHRLIQQNLDALRSYCYCVAGMVGELYTDIAISHFPALIGHVADLRKWAPNIGECLQLTNILKDERVDRQEGRSYIPRGVDTEILTARIRQGYEYARRYIDCFLEVGAPSGYSAFIAIPILMAMENLRLVESGASGQKIERRKVTQMIAWVSAELTHQRNPLQPLRQSFFKALYRRVLWRLKAWFSK